MSEHMPAGSREKRFSPSPQWGPVWNSGPPPPNTLVTPRPADTWHSADPQPRDDVGRSGPGQGGSPWALTWSRGSVGGSCGGSSSRGSTGVFGKEGWAGPG